MSSNSAHFQVVHSVHPALFSALFVIEEKSVPFGKSCLPRTCLYPNKDIISDYFTQLKDLKSRYPNNITEDDRIEVINLIKEQRSKFFSAIVDMIKPIAPGVHMEIKIIIDKLTDDLTTVIDNDELNLNNSNVIQREIVNKV